MLKYFCPLLILMCSFSFQFQFNDSHTKMVVHWAGKNSQVIISLTKGLDLGNMSVHSSHVYVSHDYGENFTNIDNKLKLANGSYALIENYYSSPVHNSHVSMI